MKFFFLLLVLSCAIFEVKGQAPRAFKDLNLSHQYDPDAEINVLSQVSVSYDSLIVNVRVKLNQAKAKIEDYRLNLFLLNSYSDVLKTPLPKHDSIYYGSRNKNYFFQYKILDDTSKHILVLQAQSRLSGYNLYFDQPIIYPTQLSIIDEGGVSPGAPWANEGRYNVAGSDTFFGNFYSHSFPPARPPMVLKSPKTSKTLTVDSTFQGYSNEKSVYLKGLYLLQSDSTSDGIGLPVLFTDRYFPKPVKLEQLTDPLIYITTKDERNNLFKDKTDKKKFDQFWLGQIKSTDRAKRTIKAFYSRVEAANRLFTTYKEGWKTDKGMVYIVCGPPDNVVKIGNMEHWTYARDTYLPKRKYSFRSAPSIFSSNHYVLLRDEKHASIWFGTIKMIRQGRIK